MSNSFSPVGVVASALCIALSGCAAPAPRYVMQRQVEAVPPRADLIAYPLRGQGEREARQDRYECHGWAVRESGFDPALTRPTPPPLAPRVVPDPPIGYDTASGAVAGAVIGGVVAHPRHAGEGAAIGAVVGALAGAASDAARDAGARRLEEAYAARASRADHGNWRQIEDYRRALSACLEGRGYSVR